MNSFNNKNRSNKNAVTTYTTAGWLFADLLLALSVIFLISSSKKGNALSTPSFSPTLTNYIASATELLSLSTPSETPSLFPTNTIIPSPSFQGPVGLGGPQCYNITLESAKVDSKYILQYLEGKIPNNQNIRAGLVLVWSHGTNVDEGVAISKTVGNVIRAYFPRSFSDAKIKSLNFDAGDKYFVQLEIYFFTDAKWHSGSEADCSYNY